MGTFDLDLHIGKKTTVHNFHVIHNLHKEAILGMNYNQLTYCLKQRSFTFGAYPQWRSGTTKVALET
jgi:hypothetical protein